MSDKKTLRDTKKRGGIVRWFREMKSELKKIVWPTWQQVANNTKIVMTIVTIMAVFIWIVDMAFQSGTTYLITLGA